VGVLVWVEFPKNWGVGGDRGTMIAAVEISQNLSSDCLQPRFPASRTCNAKKYRCFKLNKRFERVLVSISKTFLSLQQAVE
jgi:hypothetical protein